MEKITKELIFIRDEALAKRNNVLVKHFDEAKFVEDMKNCNLKILFILLSAITDKEYGYELWRSDYNNYFVPENEPSMNFIKKMDEVLELDKTDNIIESVGGIIGFLDAMNDESGNYFWSEVLYDSFATKAHLVESSYEMLDEYLVKEVTCLIGNKYFEYLSLIEKVFYNNLEEIILASFVTTIDQYEKYVDGFDESFLVKVKSAKTIKELLKPVALI